MKIIRKSIIQEINLRKQQFFKISKEEEEEGNIYHSLK